MGSVTSKNVSSVKKSWASRRRGTRPKAISGSQADWVKTSFFSPDSELPLVIEPALKSVSPASWIESNMEFVEEKLRRHGGLLFRGFGLRGTQEEFDKMLGATGIELMNYIEGATPRTQLGGKVYTSTEFPPEETIAPHNELNYVKTWPMKIWFFCVQPPPEGGETPIIDVRRVLGRLDADIPRRFREHGGWMLVRNFGDGFGPSWQHSYRTEDPADLEAYLRSADVAFEWKDKERIQTRQVRPATARHPQTGEEVWFNHAAFWHPSSLSQTVKETFLRSFDEGELPYRTCYGDGTPIADETIEQIRAAYEQEAIAFRWQQGDFLMLDNMLVAHGRRPFSGPRMILAAMGESESRRGVEV